MDQESSFSPAFAEAVGRTIKVIRTDLGLERKALAEAAGISYSYLTEIENGNKPASSSALRQIAHALGMRMSQLTEAAEHRLDAQMAISNQALGEFAPMLYAKAPPEEPGMRADAPLAARSRPAPQSAPAPDCAPAAASAPAPPDASSPAPGPSDALRARDVSRQPRPSSRDWAMQPSLRGPNRELRSLMLELEGLLRRMAPDDIERVLDFARRLAR